jgi:hypothetical protein
MIQVSIKDKNGTECNLNDVIIVHNPNEKIKYFGVLKFEDCEFYLSDLSEGSHQLPLIHWQKMERLCTLEQAPGIEKELGSVEVEDVKEFDKIFNLCH